jgi:Kef-type K+ transport system membrane component KefB
VSFLLSLAFAYALALLLGRLMSRLGLPRATAYLLVGILAGQPVLGSLQVQPLIVEGPGLQILVDFTLGLILFGIGRRFRFVQLRRYLRRILITAAVEISITFVFVAGASLLVGASPVVAALLGIIAIATAPAATMLVIREYESEGPMTDLAVLLIGINNLVSVIAFIIVVALVLPASIAETRPAALVGIALPIGTGLTIALITAAWDARIEKLVERQLLGIAAIAAIVGLAEAFEFNALFACLIAGIVIVNSSPRESAMFDAIRELD